MLPEIPDNDDGKCWAAGCSAPAGQRNGTGLCAHHYCDVRPYVVSGRINGRVFDLLGVRLNVLQETGGECLRAEGPCELSICRFHVEDGSYGYSHASAEAPEPCAIKMAGDGPVTLDKIAQTMGLTRQRIQQIEISALDKLRADGVLDAGVPGKRRAA